MNCKPGDLAIVVRGQYAGLLVEILYAAPSHSFELPNGVLNQKAQEDGDWVIEILGSPMPVKNDYGHQYKTVFGTGNDRNFRPLRGVEMKEEEEAYA